MQMSLRGVVREEGIPTARSRVSRRRALAGGKTSDRTPSEHNLNRGDFDFSREKSPAQKLYHNIT